jgi:hypothetical protein
MQNRIVGRAYDTNIFISSNLSINGSDDCTAGIFSPMALALDIRRAPRIERERDASRRADEINLSAVYAHGTWRPKFGVKLISDASVPTE